MAGVVSSSRTDGGKCAGVQIQFFGKSLYLINGQTLESVPDVSPTANRFLCADSTYAASGSTQQVLRANQNPEFRCAPRKFDSCPRRGAKTVGRSSNHRGLNV
jgi:hypothetical protein